MLKANDAKSDPALRTLLQGLQEALGARLRSVVLYGSAARGDFHSAASDLNVIVVLEPLDPAALEALAPAVRRFIRKGHPIPQLFSPALIAASADTFPVEFADIRAGHVVLHGDDPFRVVVVGREQLRLQVERELKEKLMRLREAYVLVHDRPSALSRLLTQSYPGFVALFRAGLQLLGKPAPPRASETVVAFCDVTGLDRAPFEEVARLRRREKVSGDPRSIFTGYYGALSGAADRIDRLRVEAEASKGGDSR